MKRRDGLLRMENQSLQWGSMKRKPLYSGIDRGIEVDMGMRVPLKTYPMKGRTFRHLLPRIAFPLQQLVFLCLQKDLNLYVEMDPLPCFSHLLPFARNLLICCICCFFGYAIVNEPSKASLARALGNELAFLDSNKAPLLAFEVLCLSGTLCLSYRITCKFVIKHRNVFIKIS